MLRREPPPLARWTLEHLALGAADEALMGDLLEAFQCGRSNEWCWRQALTACAVSWLESFRERSSLLVFAILWSMAAPGWNAVCIMVENNCDLSRLLPPVIGPFWIVPAALGWTILHSIFLWVGLLIFSAFHTSVGGNLNPARIKLAFLLVPAIIIPAYFAMFMGVVLNWYSIFEHFQPHGSPFSQMTDLRPLADVIRIPYLLALSGALWGTVRRTGRATSALPVPRPLDRPANFEESAPGSASSSFIARHFFALMVGAGLMNSTIAGLLVCRLPDSHFPTLASLALRAALYVLAGALAGMGGTYLYWKNPASPFSAREPLPFPLFALICTGGWVWIPAMVILAEQMSPASVFIAIIGALNFTSGLRRISSLVHNPIPRLVSASEGGNSSLFVASLYQAPVRPYGYVIALSFYVGTASFFLRSYLTATAVLVFAASVFAWEHTAPQHSSLDLGRERKRTVWRLIPITALAVLATIWALLAGVAHRNRVAETGNNPRVGDSPNKNAAQASNAHATAVGRPGYESVILWPYPDKHTVLPPIIAQSALLMPGTKQPLVIRFNGPYWYFQPPQASPGPSAHLATGTPLGFDIRSSNAIPLVMDAHQYLSASIPIAHCREIAVDIENRDNTPGEISLGVLLTAGTSTEDSTLYLGQQPIRSTRPEYFAFKRAPVLETLHFLIPEQARLRKFREITVMVFPDIEHTFAAPKIAIQQFQLFPR